ncbi:MAG: alpha/beta hydrolase [Acetobacteraceae bacterium]|nr:alpha/beta hydrolase [Acetobacteraceae bacterium]
MSDPAGFETGRLRLPDGAAMCFAHRASPSGAAPRLVLLHSLAQDHGFWTRLAACLRPEEAALLAPDLRGHGGSEGGEGDFSAERMADDVAALMDARGWPDAAIVGCSMGGCVAIAFAARHPARCRGLGLVDTTAWYGEDAERAWADRAAKAQAEGMASLAAFQVSRWFGDEFRESHPDVVRERLEVFLATRPEDFVRACRMLGSTDLRAALPSLRVPAVVVVGEQDYATPLAMSRLLAEAIPGASLRILPGARHLTPVERPQDIAAAGRERLARR